jgi:hypothetical protein
MPELDLTEAVGVRFGNVDVSAVMIANQLIWEESTADGPYYVNDVAALVPGAFTDGTPNIVTGHLVIFHNPGFVTGVRWYDGAAGAGNWIFGLWSTDTTDGHIPNAGLSTRLATKTIAATGAGLRDSDFDTPVAVLANEMYVVTRYSSTGRYAHLVTGFSGPHGAFSDADPVFIPGDDQNVSALVSGWTSADRSLFQIGSGDVVPLQSGNNGPYYGVSPIFFKSL